MHGFLDAYILWFISKWISICVYLYMFVWAYARMYTLCMDFWHNERNKDAEHKHTIRSGHVKEMRIGNGIYSYTNTNKDKVTSTSYRKITREKGVSYLTSGPAGMKADRQTLKHSGRSARAGACVWVGRKGRGAAERAQGRTGGCAGRTLSHTRKRIH